MDGSGLMHIFIYVYMYRYRSLVSLQFSVHWYYFYYLSSLFLTLSFGELPVGDMVSITINRLLDVALLVLSFCSSLCCDFPYEFYILTMCA